MTYLSIIEKFKILFDTFWDFKFILIFTILLLVLGFLYIIKVLSGKKYVLFMFISFALLFGISVVSNYKVLSNTFDNFATILFGNIYFPSVYVYIAVLTISFIVFVVSMLSINLKKIYKIINSISFVINNILFVIILNIIAKNKIDIFSINSLYTNTSLVAILELSMGMFILWILSLITVYATNCICERLYRKKVCNNVVIEENYFNPVLEVNNDIGNFADETVGDLSLDENIANVEFVGDDANYLAPVLEVNDNIVNVSCDDISNTVLEKDTYKVDLEEIHSVNDIFIEENSATIDNNIQDTITFNDILNGNIPVTYYENAVKSDEYNLIDPQAIYEDKYNKIKSESTLFDNVDISIDNNIEEKIELLVEDKISIEKEKIKEDRFDVNTVSLNDLIDREDNNIENFDNEEVAYNISMLEVKSDKQDIEGYTIDDYKKMIGMLNTLRNYSSSTNINIDDAVAISLISNYSIDDCMKFKHILESNLN